MHMYIDTKQNMKFRLNQELYFSSSPCILLFSESLGLLLGILLIITLIQTVKETAGRNFMLIQCDTY